jgi:hypothetical protein
VGYRWDDESNGTSLSTEYGKDLLKVGDDYTRVVTVMRV